MRLIDQRHSRGQSTGTTFGKDYRQFLVPSTQPRRAQQSPSLAIELAIATDMAEVTERLADIAALEEDWDDEGAAATDPEAARDAQDLIDKVAFSVLLNEFAWVRPLAAPMRNGGVTLSWHRPDRRLLLIFEPNNGDIVYVETVSGQEPIRRVVSPEGARERILVSLSN